MHHVIIDLITLVLCHFEVLTVIDAEKIVAEGGRHEELLHHRVHVADAAEVNHADVLLLRRGVGGRCRLIIPRLRLLDGSDKGLKVLSKELLHQSTTVLDKLMKQLIGGLSTLVVFAHGLLRLLTRARLLLDHNSVTIGVLLPSLEVGREKELFKDLSNQVLLADNAIAHSLVSLSNDLASERDKTDEKTLLLSSELHGSSIIFAGVVGLGLRLSLLLLLNLVDSLVEKLLGVVNRIGSTSCNSLESI